MMVIHANQASNFTASSVSTVATAPVRFGSFVLDHERNVRYVIGQEEDLERVTMRRDGDRWTTIHSSEMGGAVRSPVTFDAENKRVFFEVSEKGEPAKLVLRDPESREETPVASNPNVESVRYLYSSDERHLLAVAYMDGMPNYVFIDKDHPESKTYAGLINAFPDHAVAFSGISRDGRKVLFRAYSDVDPGTFYLFDRETGRAQFLLASRDWIKPEQMSEMTPISFTARDGTRVHGYLTVPQGSSGYDLPLILHPHGGPHGPRDSWGFNPEVQFLANRGYAVLQVNYRGSGGRGKAFEDMAYGQWATGIMNDIADATKWAIGKGYADKDRVCIYGGSFGGYAAIMGPATHPGLFKCAFGYVGAYDPQIQFKLSDTSKRDDGLAYMRRAFGATRAEQDAMSPVLHADKVKIPVYLAAGARDARCPPENTEAMFAALEAAGNKPEGMIIQSGEMHGFYDVQNRVNLYTKMLAFFDKYIGPNAKTASAP